jgi:hypothetical protein
MAHMLWKSQPLVRVSLDKWKRFGQEIESPSWLQNLAGVQACLNFELTIGKLD